MERTELKALLEAIIYVSEEPVTLNQLIRVFPETDREELRSVLDELAEESGAPQRGVEIRPVAGGYRMSTKPEHHETVRRFVRVQKPPLRLTRQGLETLAVIAYKQPVTLPEIKAVRGVDPSASVHTLLEKGLIVTAGRKEVVGRPILYRTSKDFMIRFGLKDLSELPTLEEFEDLVRAAGDEVGAAPQEEKAPPAQSQAGAPVGAPTESVTDTSGDSETNG